MMLIILQNTVQTDIPQHTGISGAYLWIALIVAVALIVYFLRRKDKVISIENKPEMVSDKPEMVSQETILHQDVHEEVSAAIAMALYFYKQQIHDKESFIITMKQVSRIYSPWSSKIYTLRQTPIRK